LPTSLPGRNVPAEDRTGAVLGSGTRLRVAVRAAMRVGRDVALLVAAACGPRQIFDVPAGELAATRSAPTPLLRSVKEALDRARGPDVNPDLKALCLSVGPPTSAVDPPDSLVAVLDTVRPPVVPYSQCEEDQDGALLERATGGRALLVFSSIPVLTDSVHATVEIGFMGGPLFGKGWNCALVHGPPGWQVKACTLKWAS
jgi:hypothetical protein